VITRVFEAPTRIGLEAWTDPHIDAVVGAECFTASVCKIDFRVGGNFSACHEIALMGRYGLNAGNNTILLRTHERSFTSLVRFADRRATRLACAVMDRTESIDDARDVVFLEGGFWEGQTKLPMIASETMEDAKNTAGQLEGWNQILDKVAAVIAGLSQANKNLKL